MLTGLKLTRYKSITSAETRDLYVIDYRGHIFTYLIDTQAPEIVAHFKREMVTDTFPLFLTGLEKGDITI